MKYYNGKEIDKTNADFKIIMGERSNGKTFNRVSTALENWKKNGEMFVYLRRFKIECTKTKIDQMLIPFNDLIFHNWGYNIYAYAGKFKIHKLGEEQKRETDETIGNYLAIEEWMAFKSVSFNKKIEMIIFDEFMTRDLYLKDEINAFTNTISTIVRMRTLKRGINLLANTVSKLCPYFAMWNINIDKLKQGQITIFELVNDKNIKTRIAFEFCEKTEGGKHSDIYFANIVSSSANMITTGEFEHDSYNTINYQNVCWHNTQKGIKDKNVISKKHFTGFAIAQEEKALLFYLAPSSFNVVTAVRKIDLIGSHSIEMRKDIKVLVSNQYRHHSAINLQFLHSTIPEVQDLITFIYTTVLNGCLLVDDVHTGEMVRSLLMQYKKPPF